MNHIDIYQSIIDCRENPTGAVHEIEYSVQQGKEILISVPGTEANLIDIGRDLRAWPYRDKRVGWGHAGFMRGAKALVKELMLTLDKDLPLVIAGHSMGAGVSMLAAVMFSAEGYMIKEWVGFGCPKMFIGRHYVPFQATIYRNGNDPVHTVPKGWVFDYNHGELIDHVQLATGKKGVDAHASIEYIKSLKALRDERLDV